MYVHTASELAKNAPPAPDDNEPERVNFRISRREKRRHEEAARLSGRTLSEFYRAVADGAQLRVDVNKNLLADVLQIARYARERYPNDRQIGTAVERVLTRYGKLI